jgi:nucleoside-diphosphate-sugar epimerase
MLAQNIATEAQLEDALSEPTDQTIECLSRLQGDIIFLGVAGKMGPTMARMARRASDAVGVARRIIGIARFSHGGRDALEAGGIETIRCDLLKEEEVAGLPDAANVVFMAGRKFGSAGDEAMTWAMNSYVPGLICRKYRRSRMVAFSTGNVYGPTDANGKGSVETDYPAPVGEYAMSCLGRERLFEYFSRTYTIPMALIRLNYACELRYGVLVDLAHRIWEGQVVDLETGYFNVIWQGDANAMALAAFAHAATPPWVVNITGPELISVRSVSERLGQLMNKPVHFSGEECSTALLSNPEKALRTFGPPRMGGKQLFEWVADWVMRGGRSLGKPTHFEVRDGKF